MLTNEEIIRFESIIMTLSNYDKNIPITDAKPILDLCREALSLVKSSNVYGFAYCLVEANKSISISTSKHERSYLVNSILLDEEVYEEAKTYLLE